MAFGSSFISNVSASGTSEIAGQDVELVCHEILSGQCCGKIWDFLSHVPYTLTTDREMFDLSKCDIKNNVDITRTTLQERRHW